ncbi:hypothetical protein ABW20_dc0108488 [Dactylellina cionopaga]|nr:hypothetical protein ABW20_dc0108488 [Dactylellina cionopaga]
MPVSTRHSAAAPASVAGQQSKLNFSAKKKNIQPGKHQNHATHDILFKSSTPPPSKLDNQLSKKDDDGDKAQVVHDPAEEPDRDEDGGSVPKPNDALQDSTKPSEHLLYSQEQTIERPKLDLSAASKARTDEAYAITAEQIKNYHQNIQSSRIGPPVHQEGLTEYEKVLRHFDLSSQYGPCTGISRFKRWNRADRFGLEPPIEVLAVMLKAELGETTNPPPEDWKPAPAAAKERVGSVAYVDELLATHAE